MHLGFPKPSITLRSFTTNPKKEVVIGTDSEWTYVSESSTGECPMKSMVMHARKDSRTSPLLPPDNFPLSTRIRDQEPISEPEQ